MGIGDTTLLGDLSHLYEFSACINYLNILYGTSEQPCKKNEFNDMYAK